MARITERQNAFPQPTPEDHTRLSKSTLLAHEWLEPHGGAENVVEQLRLAVPVQSLATLWNDDPVRFGDAEESWMGRTPLRRHKALAIPFMPHAWRSVDVKAFDRVITSSHLFCHHLASRAASCDIPAYAYVHTPARYIWSAEHDPRGATTATRTAAFALRKYDRWKTSSEVNYAANSEFIRDRIQRVWDRDAAVIYPPVDVERIRSENQWQDLIPDNEIPLFESLPDTFVLGASRLVSYKRVDFALRVAALLDLPAVIAGTGPHEPDLVDLASTLKVPVSFLGHVSDALLFTLYRRATLFVFMAVEDFGIMPVEAMALGTPVLVNEIGGAAETVRILRGGRAISATSNDEDIKQQALDAIETISDFTWNAATRFNTSRFRDEVRDWIEGS